MNPVSEELVSIRLLGKIEVYVGGKQQPLPTRHARRLLALLIMHPKHGLERRVLAEALWPGVPTSSALQSLRKALQHVRRALGPMSENIHPAMDRLMFSHEGIEIDALAMETASAQHAVELYQGHLGGGDSPDLAEEELDALWDNGWAIRLDDLHQRNLGEMARKALASGSKVDAEVWLEKAIMQDRTDEEPYLESMRLLDEAGRPEEAVRVYRRLLSALSVHKLPPSQEASDLARIIRAKIRRVARSLAPANDQPGWSALLAMHANQNPIIGRAAALAEIIARFAVHRLVTLTGPGGMGKSRLAMETAVELGHDRSFGAVWVDLSAAQNEIQAEQALLDGLASKGKPPDAFEMLYASDALLVFDNCEQALEPIATYAARLLGKAPRLAILATSREPMGLLIESKLELTGLGEPDAEALFTSRLDQWRGRLSPAAPQGLLETTGGLPLAIELLAADIAGLADETLDRHLPARHRTVASAIEESFQSCTPEEQMALGHISVLPGQFEASWAEQLLGSNARKLLSGLVRRSLIVESEYERYHLLPTVRSFAIASLGDSELSRAELAVGALAENLAETSLSKLLTVRQAEIAGELTRHLPLYRQGFSVLLEREPPRALALVTTLALGMARLGRAEEGLTMIDRALEVTTLSDPAEEARVHQAIGNLCKELGESKRALVEYSAAARLYEAAGRPRGVGACMVNSSFVHTDIGEYDEAERCLTRATQAFDDYASNATPEDLKFARLNVFKSAARIQLHRRNPNLARQIGTAGLALATEISDRHSAAVILNNLGDTELIDGEVEAAKLWLSEGLALALSLGDPGAIAFSQAGLALAHFASNDGRAAVPLLREALDAYAEASQKRDLLMIAYVIAGMAAREQLDGEALRLAFASEQSRGQLAFAFSPAVRIVVGPWIEAAKERVGQVLSNRYSLLAQGTPITQITNLSREILARCSQPTEA